RELRFDIGMLSERVAKVVDWLQQNEETKGLRIGICGSSTGAAAALVAAALRPGLVHAVVSRGGRPDLAGNHLPQVHSATLLIVGGDDTIVIGMNEEAFELLQCEKKLSIVPGATHLFEEPGTLEDAAQQAQVWFREHLA
nr:putative phosphoribosyl transferase [Chlamydiota bacterium]